MAIDFPASPTNGQTFTSGSVTYTWDGTKWTAVAAAGSSNSITQGNTNATVTDTGSDGRFVVTTEGSERARVDSSGRLLVGTSTSYGVPATIAGPAATLTTGTGTYSVLSIADTNSMAAGVGGGIAFQGNDGVNGLVAFSQVQGFKENNTSGNFAGGLSFSTRLNGAGLTERMRVDSSGRLGIATTSPSETLHVNGNARANSFLSQGWFVGQGNLTTADARSGVTGIGPSSGTDPSNFYGAYAWFYGAAHNTRPGDIEIGTGLNTNGSIQFKINNTERMRITHDGRVGINTTDYTNGRLIVTSDSSSITNTVFRETAAGSSSVNTVGFFRGSFVGTISTTTTSTAYNTSSDYRLKENVVAVTDGITRLQQLKPSRFNFIVDPEKTVDGFIAHEVQSVVPEAITGEKDAVNDDGSPIYQGIDQSKLVPLLTAALQEAVARIETLEAKVAALESPTTALEIPVDPSSTDT